METRSPVHRIVITLSAALKELGSPASPLEIEAWGFAINGALSAASRQFHNHDHVLDVASGGDPISVVAALYHDAVYIQVDQGPPRPLKAEVESVLAPDPAGGWRVLARAEEADTRDVLRVFDRRVGDLVTPMSGLNEIASAFVAAIHLAKALDRNERIAVAACIEQTIPFRADPMPMLYDRLVSLGLTAEASAEAARRAVRLGNLDVGSFAETDVARFLDSTWKLLPESNSALHVPTVHTVRDYRTALQKMEGFLGGLPADRVFHEWGGEPSPGVHAANVSRAGANLAVAVRYLRAKLYSIAIVEAIAACTGGDVPLDYFMGGVPVPGGPAVVRIEHFLPKVSPSPELDPTLHRLLAEGRASDVSFDTGSSPLGAFLHATIGEEAIGLGVEHAKEWWAGRASAHDFLKQQPPGPVGALARAAARIVTSRVDRLTALADELDPP